MLPQLRLIILFAAIVIVLTCCGDNKLCNVRTIEVDLDSIQQVAPLLDSSVKPILYTNLKGFEKLPPLKSKQVFIAALLPAILVSKHEAETWRRKCLVLQEKKRWSRHDSTFYAQVKSRFRLRSIEEAQVKICTPPNSIVLAQAAIESGWGRSRFFSEAHNVFGVWSFSEAEPRVTALIPRGKQSVYVKAYPSVSASIQDYFQLLSNASAFKNFRIASQGTTDPYKLVPYLRNYSERRGEYIALVRKIMSQNNLTQYDTYRIHPDYLVEQ